MTDGGNEIAVANRSVFTVLFHGMLTRKENMLHEMTLKMPYMYEICPKCILALPVQCVFDKLL